MWSLWNPITSQIINFPPLILRGSERDKDDIIYSCCLSAPPDHPNSVLLLMRSRKHKFVYCSLGSDSFFPNTRKRKVLRWTEMTYAKQIRSITGFDGWVHSPTYCNGKVYASIKVFDNPIRILLVEVEIMVKYHKRKKRTQVVITLLPILEFPKRKLYVEVDCYSYALALKGSCIDLFTIRIGIKDTVSMTVGAVNVFKLDMDNKRWEEVDDLKDTMFTLELVADLSPVLYSSAIASSAFGGYVHIFWDNRKIINSYHVKDKTFSVSFGPCLAGSNHLSVWEMPECTRLEDAHAQIVERSVKCDHEVNFNCTKDDSHLLLPTTSGYKCRLESDHAESEQEDDMDNDIIVRLVNGNEDELHLLNIPLHVLEVVMEFCVGVEYLKFRSTCKLCHSAAPLIQCNNGKASKRLQTLLSPWLMVFNKHRGVMTFTDPMFGDKYFIKTPVQLICDFEIKYVRYGWLLISKTADDSLVFFNPFTSDIRELPELFYISDFCFSAPPTSPDCMVVGLANLDVFIYFVSGEPSWRHVRLDLDNDLCSYPFLTLYGHDLYAMRDNGGLDVYKEMGREDLCWERYVRPAPTSCCTSFPQSYQVRCEEHLLQVIVGKFGESVEVFKLNGSTQEWVKINGLGKHMIFISSVSSLCIEAKIPEMENKIYFPRLSSERGNMVFYSLETCMYHTFNNKFIQEEFADFFGTKHFLTRPTWIEPSWC
ncbi:hypothetical protein Tco_1252029 [Tanacetum coccineum]